MSETFLLGVKIFSKTSSIVRSNIVGLPDWMINTAFGQRNIGFIAGSETGVYRDVEANGLQILQIKETGEAD